MIGFVLRARLGRGLIMAAGWLFGLGADWISEGERACGTAPADGAGPILQEIKDLIRTIPHLTSI